METVKVIIVDCVENKSWYKDLRGKKFHVYGTMDKPILYNNEYLTCVENSASIHIKDVIFIR
ncbi:MAG: hypothetical protein ACOC3Z_03315 [Nanoarchaeota archaeon]